MFIRQFAYFNILIAAVESSRILFIPPIISPSHKLSLVPWADELARRGHDVVMWAPSILPDKYVTKVAKTIHFIVGVDDQEIMDKYVYYNASSAADFTWHSFDTIPTVLAQYTYGTIPFMEQLLTQKAHREKFDSIVGQHWDLIIIDEVLNIPGYVVAVLSKSPLIMVSTTNIIPTTAYYSGIPSPPTWLPPVGMAEGISDKMDIVDRFRCTMTYITDILSNRLYTYWTTERLRKLLPEIPSIENARIDPEFVFLNHLKGFDWARPLTPNTEYIGGIHMSDPSIKKPITYDLQSTIDKFDSFILVAMGHIVNWGIAPTEVRNAFWNALRRVPEKHLIIWQYTGEVPSNLPSNIVLVKWVPQYTLLNNPKIKLFVSHCGGHSTIEAIHAAVPVLALPFFVDQYDKANGLVSRGAAIRLYKTEITADKIHSSVMELVDNPRYKLSMLKLKSVVDSQMESPLDRAVFWTEFVLNNTENNFLKPSAMLRMYFIQYYCIDVLLVLVISLYLFVRVVRKLFRLIMPRNGLIIKKKNS